MAVAAAAGGVSDARPVRWTFNGVAGRGDVFCTTRPSQFAVVAAHVDWIKATLRGDARPPTPSIGEELAALDLSIVVVLCAIACALRKITEMNWTLGVYFVE